MHVVSSPVREDGVTELSRGLLLMLDLSIREAEIAHAFPLSKLIYDGGRIRRGWTIR